jgi:hypothetical protein
MVVVVVVIEGGVDRMHVLLFCIVLTHAHQFFFLHFFSFFFSIFFFYLLSISLTFYPCTHTAIAARFRCAVQGFRRNGSAAIDMCYVACGRQDAYWEVVLCPWDYGAGAVIVAEAGGCARNLDGDAELGIGLMTTPVYATNGKPGVQDSLLAAVRETRKARAPVKRG